LGLITLTL